jgi:hypothetical protein
MACMPLNTVRFNQPIAQSRSRTVRLSVVDQAPCVFHRTDPPVSLNRKMRRSLDPHSKIFFLTRPLHASLKHDLAMINDWHLIGLILIVGYSGRLVSLILSPFPTGVAVSPSPPSTVTATNKSERERSKQLISAAPEGHTYRS